MISAKEMVAFTRMFDTVEMQAKQELVRVEKNIKRAGQEGLYYYYHPTVVSEAVLYRIVEVLEKAGYEVTVRKNHGEKALRICWRE